MLILTKLVTSRIKSLVIMKNGKKYLIIDLTEKHEKVFSGIRSEIETLNGGKELFYGKNYARIEVSTDDNLSLNKQLKISNVNNNYQMRF